MSAPYEIAKVCEVYKFKADMASDRKPMFFADVDDPGYQEFLALKWSRARFSGVVRQNLFARQSDKKKLCDIIPLHADTLVSLRGKAIIEEFEPGTHGFYPIQLIAKDGSCYPDPYFVLMPGHFMNAFLGRAYKQWPLNVNGEPYLDDRVLQSVYSGALWGGMSRPEINGRHLWMQIFSMFGAFFISDELHARFVKEKFLYADYWPCDVFDIEWVAEREMAPYLRWAKDDPKRIDDIVKNYPEWTLRHFPEWLNR